MGVTPANRLYSIAVGDDDARLCRDIPDDQCRDQPENFVLHVAANAASKIGDALSDVKVILPWLLGVIGAPSFLLGFLVPIRESLSLLPQMLVGGVIRRFAVRKGFWVASSLIEGVCVLAMALVALAGPGGALAGWLIVGLLAVFSTARGVASIAQKDTLGKTVSKGKRGRVNGFAAAISGVVAVAVGVYLAASPPEARPDWVLYALIAAAGASWLVAAAFFVRIREYPGATDGGRSLGEVVRGQIATLLADRELQIFLVVRALMMASALSSPIYIALAQRETGLSLSGLGWFVVATGLANAASSSVWGALSDKSSRATMVAASSLGGAVGVAVLAALYWAPGLTAGIPFFAAAVFLLSIAHAGVRIGRKTHIVDLAGGDNKSAYVALSNTAIGILMLAVGGGVGVLMSVSAELALGTLTAMALLGAGLAATMRNVQA